MHVKLIRRTSVIVVKIVFKVFPKIKNARWEFFLVYMTLIHFNRNLTIFGVKMWIENSEISQLQLKKLENQIQTINILY